MVTLGGIVNPRQGTYSTATWLREFFKTGGGMVLNFTTVENWYVSVTDAARLHLAALLDDSVDGQRLWAAAGPIPLNQVLAIWRKAFPDKKDKLPKDLDLPPGPAEVLLDNSKSLELLKRMGRPGWDPLESVVVANVADIANEI